MDKIKLGKYQHYKGNFYKVLGVGHHSETFEELVFYKRLFTSSEYGKNALWVRPKKMFSEEVEVKGKKVPRFKYIEEEVPEEKRQEDKEKAVLLALNKDMALIRRDLEIHGMKKDGSTIFISRSKDYDLLWTDALNALNELS